MDVRDIEAVVVKLGWGGQCRYGTRGVDCHRLIVRAVLVRGESWGSGVFVNVYAY